MSRATRITGPLRRLLLTLLVIIGTAAAVRLLASVLAADGLSIPEVGILVLFTLTFAWICMAFWTAIAGFVLHVFGLRSLVRAGQLAEPPDGADRRANRARRADLPRRPGSRRTEARRHLPLPRDDR